MRNLVWFSALAVLLTGCDAGNLGFYLYPQAAATEVVEERSSGPLAGLEVVGYLPAYKIGSFDTDQARHLTDLVYTSLAPRSDGSLHLETLTPARLDVLKQVKRDHGVRILLGVADHNPRGALASIASDPDLRARFASRLTDYLVAQGFDGADFDWEYPAEDQQRPYAALLGAIQKQFSSLGLRLSVAVSPDRPLATDSYDAVDRVHAMMYDDYGRHSTLEKVSDHVEAMVAQGVAPSKLVLGVPFYGRGYTKDGPAWSSALSYKTLRERYRLDPTQDTVSGYYFNGIDTVRRKVQFAKGAGLSGVMIWEIGQDTSDESSLLAAITQARKDLARWN